MGYRAVAGGGARDPSSALSFVCVNTFRRCSRASRSVGWRTPPISLLLVGPAAIPGASLRASSRVVARFYTRCRPHYKGTARRGHGTIGRSADDHGGRAANMLVSIVRAKKDEWAASCSAASTRRHEQALSIGVCAAPGRDGGGGGGGGLRGARVSTLFVGPASVIAAAGRGHNRHHRAIALLSDEHADRPSRVSLSDSARICLSARSA